MPWFWGSKNKSGDDDNDEYSDEYTDEEYSDEEYTDEEYSDEEEERDEGEGEVRNDDREEKDDESFVKVTQKDGFPTLQGTTKDQIEKLEEESHAMRSNSLLDAAGEDNLTNVTANSDENREKESGEKFPNSVSSISEEAPNTSNNNDVEEEEEIDDATGSNTNEEPSVRKDYVIDGETDLVPSSATGDLQVSDDDDSAESGEGDGKEDKADVPSPFVIQPKTNVQVETVDEGSSDEESSVDTDSEEEEEEVTSFADKQSLLLLAAENDRVDIMKAILAEETDDDKNTLMNSGIPPLHVAVSFGSTNTTQSLLRMGADPSIRPNVAEVKKECDANERKFEIKNMGRFDGMSAWELAFGNDVYEQLKASGAAKKSSWVFGLPSSIVDDETGSIVYPLEIQPSKREGIRHAFTAEALRCLGGDELDRLKQLLASGMPPTTEIAEKDLYAWAVEMGALRCEEHLRPVEAAKHTPSGMGRNHAGDPETDAEKPKTGNSEDEAPAPAPQARVLDRSRPGDETCDQLRNRLVELGSLSTALSTCLDGLAEEVSVCHGLLLMSGGASALASHVKSLKSQKVDKEEELAAAYNELDALEQRLSAHVAVSGKVGKEVLQLSDFALQRHDSADTESKSAISDKNGDAEKTEEDLQSERKELLGQIALSENKIRKLRISIADLSEESARDLKEVERRGLTGGVDLVRNLRDEIRDIEFELAEVKSLNATCQTKISLIRVRAPEVKAHIATPPPKPAPNANDTAIVANGAIGSFKSKEEGQASGSKTASERITTGDSQAIAIRPPGNQGFFRVDLWQILLRIIGMNKAADKRAFQIAQQQRQQQKEVGTEKRPELVHVMTV